MTAKIDKKGDIQQGYMNTFTTKFNLYKGGNAYSVGSKIYTQTEHGLFEIIKDQNGNDKLIKVN